MMKELLMGTRIEWDKYEIALLIDACEQVNQKKIPKREMVSKLSADLRHRAVKNGIIIDDIFRNENGISLQMTKMDYILTDGKNGLPGASKLYVDIAKLRKNNPREYLLLLCEAKNQVRFQGTSITFDNKSQFKKWLLTNAPEDLAVESIVQALDEGSLYCLSHKISKDSFWNICNQAMFNKISATLLNGKFYRLTHWSTVRVLDKAVTLYSRYLNSLKKEKAPNQEKVSSDNDLVYSPESILVSRGSDERERLYQKLYAISQVYDEPSGLSISKIMELLGNSNNEQLVKEILNGASWATHLSAGIYSFSKKPVSAVCKAAAPYTTNSLVVVNDAGFNSYLHDECGLAESTCRSYVSAIRTAESFARSNGFAACKIYDCIASEALQVIRSLLSTQSFIDFNNQQHNRLSAAFAKFAEFVGQTDSIRVDHAALPGADVKTEPNDYDKGKFVQILMRRYRNGMQFDSIDFDIFRETYEDLFDERLAFSDNELEERLRNCGVFYKDRLFPAAGILDAATGERLFEYIDTSFSSGKKVVYYKAIFEDLADLFASCFTLCDEQMLKAYIEFVSEKDKYYFFPEYMSIEKNVSINHSKEVEEYLLKAGKPIAIDEVCSALSHIPRDQVVRIITTDDHFLRNAKGDYFHVNIFEASETELEHIAEIINGFIKQNEYAIWKDVWNEIQEKMPVFLENNLYLSGLGVRNVLAQRLNGRFYFESAVISRPEDRFAMRDIYQLYAKHHSEFTADDIYYLSKELDTVIYFDALAGVSVRVSHDLFVSKDKINFDIEAIDKAIESFMSNDYIRIREIDSFLSFPNVGYEWNEYLLESFTYSFSKKFLLLNNGFSLNNVAGAIVKKQSSIKEFVDACAAVLAEAPISLNKKDALNYLAEVNMITRRSYRDLDVAIRKANQIRVRKG